MAFKVYRISRVRKTHIELFGCFSECIEYYSTKSYSFTGIHDGVIVGVGGVYPLWKGVGEAFVLTSEFFSENKIMMAKYCKQVFKIIENSLTDIHRIQACVKADYEQAKKFANFLGFKEEGLC